MLFFFVVILGWSYFPHTRSEERAGCLCCVFVGLFSGNHYFVPDKLEAGALYVLCAGQIVLGAFLHKDIRIFMILDIGWAGLDCRLYGN